ncbi:MAG: hypothetical protein PHN39_02150 [Candidatus Pacebacteria bacterium]|nr:hypothetical protein [Candidatus Paceibacterota bacterium]
MPKKSKTKPILCLALIAFVPLLGFYLFQVGDAVQTSFLIKNSQAEIEGLKENNLALQAEAARTLSLADLESKMTAMNFVPIQNVKYLSAAKPLAQKPEITYNK